MVKRLSVAVLVDGTYATATDGTHEYRTRSSEELEQLTGLVRGAVGFDAQRGDKVDVVSMRFADAEAKPRRNRSRSRCSVWKRATF